MLNRVFRSQSAREEPSTKFYGWLGMDMSPVPKEFQSDAVLGVFIKRCSFDPQLLDLTYFPSWPITYRYAYIDAIITSYHDPVREIIAYSIINQILPASQYELFPALIAWRVLPTENKFEVALRLAKHGTLAEYYNLDEAENGVLLQDSVAGSTQQKLSLGLRFLFDVYALNYIADIAHNDLHSTNVLIDTTEHSFVEIRYLDASRVTQSMLIPTYGVKPLICDFGTITQHSTTHSPIDDYARVLLTLDGTLPDLKKLKPERAKREVVIATGVRLYRQLMALDPTCTATANTNNTCVLDLTHTVDLASLSQNQGGKCVVC